MNDKEVLREIGKVVDGHYSGYTVYVDPIESKTSVYYSGAADGSDRLIRVTHRIFRTPSARRLMVQHFQDSSPEDRLFAEQSPHRLGALFRRNEHVAKRGRRSDGTWWFSVAVGRVVDEPFAQLELEMMIDSEAWDDRGIRRSGTSYN